jgi:hypothetical protein
MGIPRVRFTIRLLMITVAVVGVFLTAARLAFFWRHYQALAAMHASKEVNYIRQAQQYERKQEWCARQATIANEKSDSVRGSTWERGATSSGATAHDLRQLAAHESRLRNKYERAAAHPWLPVEADPPGPPKP